VVSAAAVVSAVSVSAVAQPARTTTPTIATDAAESALLAKEDLLIFVDILLLEIAIGKTDTREIARSFEILTRDLASRSSVLHNIQLNSDLKLRNSHFEEKKQLFSQF
jgi:hypothetical protein